jgi:DNA polymerase-4
MPRKIIHVDLDAFFCAVEEQRNPSLKGKPFAVGGRPDERGVVASCSYPARRYGIRSAMPMSRAIKLCPELIIVPTNHREYGIVSHRIFSRLGQITDQIEQISIDEAFLDVTNSPQEAEEIAVDTQKIIRDEFGLSATLGVASNKLVAKIATDFGKSAHVGNSPPNAITVVKPGEEAIFLAPLPAEALWGVGPKTAEKLAEMGIYTIGDIASWPHEELVKRFGRHGDSLSKFSKGLDDSPITTTHVVKSISCETTFAKDTCDRKFIEKIITSFSDRLSVNLKEDNLVGVTVKIKIRWSDFTTLTRQSTIEIPTDKSQEIYAISIKLLNWLWDGKRPIRLVGVGVSNLTSPKEQLLLWEFKSNHQPLEKALTELKNKYGDSIITKGKT